MRSLTPAGIAALAAFEDARAELAACAPTDDGDAHEALAREDGRLRAALELAHYLLVLEQDEIRVLTRIAARLAKGLEDYGRLQLATDRRDFRGKEAREEIEDFLVYSACAWLKAEVAGGAQ